MKKHGQQMGNHDNVWTISEQQANIPKTMKKETINHYSEWPKNRQSLQYAGIKLAISTTRGQQIRKYYNMSCIRAYYKPKC